MQKLFKYQDFCNSWGKYSKIEKYLQLLACCGIFVLRGRTHSSLISILGNHYIHSPYLIFATAGRQEHPKKTPEKQYVQYSLHFALSHTLFAEFIQMAVLAPTFHFTISNKFYLVPTILSSLLVSGIHHLGTISQGSLAGFTASILLKQLFTGPRNHTLRPIVPFKSYYNQPKSRHGAKYPRACVIF